MVWTREQRDNYRERMRNHVIKRPSNARNRCRRCGVEVLGKWPQCSFCTGYLRRTRAAAKAKARK